MEDEFSISQNNPLFLGGEFLDEYLGDIKSIWSNPSDTVDNYLSINNFQGILNIILNSDYDLTRRQFNQFYRAIMDQPTQAILTFTFNNSTQKTITINNNTKQFLNDYLRDRISITRNLEEYGSDVLEQFVIENITNMTIRFLPPRETKVENDGGFFPFINTSHLDLSKYQIYNQQQVSTKDETNCLIYSLQQAGIDDSKINNVKLAFISGANISKNQLKKLPDMIGKNILLRHTDKRGKTNKQNFKNKTNTETIEIALRFNHYFNYEKTKYTIYYIKNMDKIEKLIEEGKIKMKEGKCKYNISKIQTTERKGEIKYNTKFTKDKYCTTLEMINELYKLNKFQKLDLTEFVKADHDIESRESYSLLNIKNEQKEIKPYVHNINENQNIHYSDIESYVNGSTHEIAMIGTIDTKNHYNCYDDDDKKKMILKYLNTITFNGTKDALVYFHNLKYDFHMFSPYIKISSICRKDGNIYNVYSFHKKAKIKFCDSFKLLPMALSKFSKSFNLGEELSKKEAIAYKYYTKKNKNKRININEYLSYLPVSEKKIFLKNMDEESSFDVVSNTFNPTTYYKRYLKYDCMVLKAGLEAFNKIIKEITNNKMSVYDCLTISSLTDRYMRMKGCYDGVFENTGNLRKFISNAVYGGRVHANTKYQKKIINKKIADYDGVSLYPSAIHRLCKEKGLPKGAAKLLTNLSSWNTKFYSIMKVNITNVNKEQQMPMITNKKDSSIEYVNVKPDTPIIIDSITLEDWINYHEIEYEIIEGVYWDNGGNKKMGDVIQELFNRRLQAKKEKKQALQQVLKLMLNSAYGKTIMKKSKKKNYIINGTTVRKNSKGEWIEKNNFDYYVSKYFNTINGIVKLRNGQYDIERLHIDDSYNRGQCGSMILSYSKRIMNEVFDIANENKLPIYYTDTDSIHMNYDDVPILEEEFQKKYNRNVTGKQLGQFHIDFDLDGACDEIYSKKAIFLGKKSYIDVLESKDKNGDLINGLHYRMKGITKEGIIHKAKQIKGDILDVYEKLAQGEKMNITLNPYDTTNNSEKVLFEFSNLGVSTKKEFIRVVSF